MILTSTHLNNASICGRMGNQIFIISSIVGLARRTDLEYNLPWNYADRFNTPCAPKGKIPTGSATINYKEKSHDLDNNLYTFINNHKEFKGYMSVNGFLQDHRYFHEYREDIVKMFKSDDIIHKDTCAIHVRRGDYLKYPKHHPACGLPYYNKGIDIIKDKNRDCTFKVFSDDIAWCKGQFKGDEFVFVEGNDEVDDLLEMSRCENNIIANSTFSWLGAYFNQNPDKTVIKPKLWFGPASPHKTKYGYSVEGWTEL